MKAADATAAMDEWLRYAGITDYVQEHRFAQSIGRRWRFDFAWLNPKFALEVEGVVWKGKGRHQSAQGLINDCEKYEAALILGWTVYRIPQTWIYNRGERVWRSEVIDCIRHVIRHNEEVTYELQTRTGPALTGPGTEGTARE